MPIFLKAVYQNPMPFLSLEILIVCLNTLTTFS